MLIFDALALGDRLHFSTVSSALLDVVNGNISVRVTYSDVILLLLGVGTASDTVLRGNCQFRIGRVFQSPEAK